MNCGPADALSQEIKQGLAEIEKRRATTAERKRSNRERQVRELHEYVRLASRLGKQATATRLDIWSGMLAQAAFHYGRLAQQLGETTNQACRAAWRKYLEESR
jgi:hypothetical protein